MDDSTPKPRQHPPSSSSPLSSFIYKATFLCLLLLLLSLLPSHSPDSATNTFLNTLLELLHLLLVGIAVSYGLFSRKNSDPEPDKDNQTKSDTQILNSMSVFDDDETTKTQTWNYSRCSPEEPQVSVTTARPLFLPVRSLKIVQGDVLPSPIPWRSRSGRMEAAKEPSPSMSSEIGAKTTEDLERNKSFVKSSPPPAPPPPPPRSSSGYNLVRENKDDRSSYVGKSVRTVRAKEELLPRKRREKRNAFREKMIIESDSSDSSDSDIDDNSKTPDAENEVDKKADEFIAKFREQIRLQRIDAIKKSTSQQRSVRS